MAFDHYIPAAFLARFSLDTDAPRRSRRVWVVDKHFGRLFQTPVSSICGAHELYSVAHENPRIIDKMWSGYEGRLNEALDALVIGTLDARTWLNTVVQFVSAVFVRGLDFPARLEARLVRQLGGGVLPLLRQRPDNANWARLMEWQRLRASVIGARWTVLRTTGRVPQITTDVVFNAHLESATNTHGVAIPIDLRHILAIRPTVDPHVIAFAMNGTWRPNIDYRPIDEAQQQNGIDIFAGNAQRFVIGPDKETMRQYISVDHSPPPVPEPVMLGFMGGAMARRYEHTQLRVLGELAKAPQNDGDVLYVNYAGNMPSAGAP